MAGDGGVHPDRISLLAVAETGIHQNTESDDTATDGDTAVAGQYRRAARQHPYPPSPVL